MDGWTIGLFFVLFILIITAIVLAGISLHRTSEFSSEVLILNAPIGALTQVQTSVLEVDTPAGVEFMSFLTSSTGQSIGPRTEILLSGLVSFAIPVTNLNLTFTIKTTTDNVDKRNTVFVFSPDDNEDITTPTSPFQKQIIKLSTGVPVNVSMKITIPSIYISLWGLAIANVLDDPITDARTYVISNFKITGSNT